MDRFVALAEDWAPALIVGAVGVLFVVLSHRALWKRNQASASSPLSILGPLFTLIVSGIVVVAVMLSLPIGDEAKGQLLGLLGLLVTAAVALSSTTFLGNALAGIMLRAIRNFRPGDYLRVGEHAGRVSEQGILHTEIQTEDRDLTTIPNLYLVTHPVTVLRASGTVVSAGVSLGYDVDYHEVEKLLMSAASDAGLTDPFVQVEELGDYSITYRAAGFLTEVKQLLSTRSRIRKAMLDRLHGANIEIVSPAFINRRDVEHQGAFVPQNHPRRRRLSTASIPETRIFDKADEAEARGKLEAELAAQQARVDRLKEELTASTFEVERRELQSQLQAAEERLEAIEACLKPDGSPS
jgi:small-conductance mechanosensitive channel